MVVKVGQYLLFFFFEDRREIQRTRALVCLDLLVEAMPQV